MININGNASGFYKSMAGVHNTLLRAQHSTGAVNAAFRRMALGYVASVGMMLKMTLDFDRAYTRSIMAIKPKDFDEASVSVDGLRKKLLDLSMNSLHSAKELAQSVEYLSQAGLDLKEITGNDLGLVRFVSAFAKTGSMELKTATDLLTDAATAMKGLVGLTKTGDIAKDMIIIGNELTKVASVTNTSVREISLAITNKAGPAARMFNMTLEQTIILLGIYANQGKKGAAAGSLLEQTMRYLTQAYSDNAEVFARHGINPFGEDGKGGFQGVKFIKEITEAMEGLSVVEKFAFLRDDLGMSAKTMLGIFPLLNMHKEFEQIKKDMEEANDVQARMDLMLDSISGKVTVLKNAFMGLIVTIGEALVPVMEALVPKLQTLAQWFQWLFSTAAGKWAATVTIVGVLVAGVISAISLAYQALMVNLVAVILQYAEWAVVKVAHLALNFKLTLSQYGLSAAIWSTVGAIGAFIAKAVIATAGVFLLVAAIGYLALKLSGLDTVIGADIPDVNDIDPDEINKKLQEGLDTKVFDVKINPIISSRALEDSFVQQLMALSSAGGMLKNQRELAASVAAQAIITGKTQTKQLSQFEESNAELNRGSEATADLRAKYLNELQEAKTLAASQGAADHTLEQLDEAIREMTETFQGWEESWKGAQEWNSRNNPGQAPAPTNFQSTQRFGAL